MFDFSEPIGIGVGQWPQQQVLRAGTPAMVQLAAVVEAGALVQPQGRVVAAVDHQYQLARPRATPGEVGEHGLQRQLTQAAALPGGIDEEPAQAQRRRFEVAPGHTARRGFDAVVADRRVATQDRHRFAVGAQRHVGQQVGDRADPAALDRQYVQAQQLRAQCVVDRDDADGGSGWHVRFHGGGGVPWLL